MFGCTPDVEIAQVVDKFVVVGDVFVDYIAPHSRLRSRLIRVEFCITLCRRDFCPGISLGRLINDAFISVILGFCWAWGLANDIRRGW